jgi:hypothetical protein
MIDALAIAGTLLVIGFWFYRTGKRTGSREGYHGSRSHSRRR